MFIVEPRIGVEKHAEPQINADDTDFADKISAIREIRVNLRFKTRY
jgi:hypothetical protein